MLGDAPVHACRPLRGPVPTPHRNTRASTASALARIYPPLLSKTDPGILNRQYPLARFTISPLGPPRAHPWFTPKLQAYTSTRVSGPAPFALRHMDFPFAVPIPWISDCELGGVCRAQAGGQHAEQH